MLERNQPSSLQVVMRTCTAGNYMFKVNSRRHRRRFGVFIVNFEHISHLCSSVSIVNFEQVSAGWA